MSKKGKEEIPATPANPDNPANNGSWKNMLKLWAYVLPYKWWFIFGMVFLLLSTLTSLSLPWLIGQLVDAATGAKTKLPFDLNGIAFVMGGILLLQAIFSYLRIFSFAKVSERAISNVRRSVYNKVITLPMVFFEKRRVGELTSRITSDVAQLQDMLSMALAEFFRQVATLIIGLTVMLVISPELTIRMLLVVPLMAVAAMYFGRFIRKLSKERQDALAESNVVAEESMQNIQMVKAFTNEPHEIERYKGFQERVVRFALKAAHYRGLFTSFIIFALFGGIILMLWYGARLVQAETMTIGELTTFIFYTMFIGGSISGMGELYARIQRTLGASERVLEILGEEAELNAETAIDDQQIQGTVAYSGIDFAYPTRTDINVLENFNLEIDAGEKIALAGHSGSGKSTIVQLLLGFYETAVGTIKLDGQNISELNPRKLRSSIAIVPQEVILFGGTIKENIAYGRTGASEQEIIEAAHQANAWEFIEQFPEGLETVVGERGVKLSGGQRQRVAIARAILKDPAILILDEATSSLDAASESLVQEALEKLMEGRTTIIIAHRLSTIRHVDRIYVLSKGKIAQTGSYEELAAVEDGIFFKLLKLQFEEQWNPNAVDAASV